MQIQILFTQKWVAQCDAPLRSGKHTERIFVYKLYGFWFGYFINTALLIMILIICTQKYGGRTSLFLTSQRMPSRYGLVHMRIQSNKSSLRKMFIGDIFDSIFYRYNVVGEDTYSMYTKMGGAM